MCLTKNNILHVYWFSSVMEKTARSLEHKQLNIHNWTVNIFSNEGFTVQP